MKYLLDIDTCIHLIRQKSRDLVQRLVQHPISDFGISSITVAELEYGVQKSSRQAQNRQALSQFLIPLTIVDFDSEAAVAYGSIRARLEGEGTPVGSLDTLIAAHAVSLSVELITGNTAEFARVPQLQVRHWSSL